LKTPWELGGSGRYFKVPVENPKFFWKLFDEFISRWPKGVEACKKGLIFVEGITNKQRKLG